MRCLRSLSEPIFFPSPMQRKVWLARRADSIVSAKRFIFRYPFDEKPHRARMLWSIPPVQPANAVAQYLDPIEIVRERLRSRLSIDARALAAALCSCHQGGRGAAATTTTSLTQLHGLAISSGLHPSAFLSNCLINMYSKTGSFHLACHLFAHHPTPDIVSWNTILSGFSRSFDALEFTARLHRCGVSPDAVTFALALSFSSNIQDLEFSLQLHSLALKSGLYADVFVGNALITAYSRSGYVDKAKALFHEMPVLDLVSWNSLISGLTQGDSGREAVEVFVEMISLGVKTDHIALASVISASCQEDSLVFVGILAHGRAIKAGLDSHISVSNILMSMYYKRGDIDLARRMFGTMKARNVISWTTMISIDPDRAMALFDGMRLEDIRPNQVTFVTLISAISEEENIQRDGQVVHGACFQFGCASELNVSNSLITMYAKLGSMEDSERIFSDMYSNEVISWNALISGYVQNDLCEDALHSFFSLLPHCLPNQYTYGSILSAITSGEQTLPLAYGQRIHCRIIKSGFDADEHVGGALIDMYAKRGSIRESHMVFDSMAHKSLLCWTAIISAHAKHGNYLKVTTLFDSMTISGIRPDEVTFLAVLTSCRCKGMVDVGCHFFDVMVQEYGIDPWPEHYACMVDILGSSGRLDEAEHFLRRVPGGARVSALQSLLGACRVHGDVDIGERVAELVVEMQPAESGAYVLMSNMYAAKGKWEEVAKVRSRMRNMGVKKEVGFSWVDLPTTMNRFSSDDLTHPNAQEIYHVAHCLACEMRAAEQDSYPHSLVVIGGNT